MTRAPEGDVVRPVPRWVLTDWIVAFTVSGVVVSLAVAIGPPTGGTGAVLIGGWLLVGLALGPLLRRSGSLRFEADRIVVVRWLVFVRRVAWSDVREVRLKRVVHADADSTDVRLVRLVLYGGREVGLPLSLPLHGRDEPGSDGGAAVEVFVRHAAAHRKRIPDLDG